MRRSPPFEATPTRGIMNPILAVLFSAGTLVATGLGAIVVAMVG
jgi:hypothetical protein